MSSNGWIKLHRKMKEWRWYKDLPTKSLFIHLLFEAEWSDVRCDGIVIRKGQVVTTEKDLSTETGLSRQQVRTAISHLISTNEITKTSTNKKTVITIENYNIYQAELIGCNQNINQEDNQNSNQQVTNEQPTGNQPTIDIKNNKNLNNYKNNNARARVKHADGVYIIEDEDKFTPPMREEYRENLDRMREQTRRRLEEFYRELGEE